jgi:hypothetical protein
VLRQFERRTAMKSISVELPDNRNRIELKERFAREDIEWAKKEARKIK